jgi:hypothetical protein
MVFAAIALIATRQSARTIAAENPSASPSHQVIACYFHRTIRCDTCKKISAYIDEAVRTGFAPQVKDGGVKMVMVDFQDEKNKKLTQAYKITGPTLVIMDVRDGETTAWKPAPKVWSLVGKKDDFFKYVQAEIQVYLDDKKTASR